MNQKLNIITNNFKKEIWTPLWKFLTADRLLRNLHKQFIQLSRIKQKMNHHAEIEIASMMKIQTKSVMITPLTQIWQSFKYKYVLDVFWSQPIKYVMKIKVNTILILIIILQKLDFGTKKSVMKIQTKSSNPDVIWQSIKYLFNQRVQFFLWNHV